MIRRIRLLAIALLAWLVACALAAVAVIGVSSPASAQTGILIGKAHAGFAPSLSGKPIAILVVGSGARPGDDVMHSLADSLHVLTINPDKHKATIVGIPRDSWVEIPGNGTSKINASLVDGGPDLLVQTVEQLSGLTIDYWALTTFWGITDLIDELGGLTMDVPFSMHDPLANSDFEPGVQTLTGGRTLAFARDRHSFSQGDLARSENGGRVLLALLAQFRKAFQRDQSSLFAWLAAGMKHADGSIPITEAIDLAFTSSHVNPAGVANVVLPGSTGMEGGLSVVFLSSSSTQAIFTDIASDGILSKKNRPPSPTANE